MAHTLEMLVNHPTRDPTKFPTGPPEATSVEAPRVFIVCRASKQPIRAPRRHQTPRNDEKGIATQCTPTANPPKGSAVWRKPENLEYLGHLEPLSWGSFVRSGANLGTLLGAANCETDATFVGSWEAQRSGVIRRT